MDASPRFIAFDVHKHYILAAGIDAAQQIVLPPRKITVERFAEWARSPALIASMLLWSI